MKHMWRSPTLLHSDYIGCLRLIDDYKWSLCEKQTKGKLFGMLCHNGLGLWITLRH